MPRNRAWTASQARRAGSASRTSFLPFCARAQLLGLPAVDISSGIAEKLRQESGAFFFRQLHQIGGERVEVDSFRGFRFAGASTGASVGRRRRNC